MPKKAKETGVQWMWKPATRVAIKADVFGEVLEKIRATNDGVASNEAIVEAARPKDSPIHSLFEWDNSAAAEKYRQEQARYYARHVIKVISRPTKEKPAQTRIANICVKGSDGKSERRDAVLVMTDKEMRLQAIEDCLKLLMGIRRRFAHIVELSKIFMVIDTAVEDHFGAEGKKVEGF
jgi:hypothetical protein